MYVSTGRNEFDSSKYYALPAKPETELEDSIKRKIYNINELSGNDGLISLLLSSFRNLDWTEYDKDRNILKKIIVGLESIAMRNHKICKTGRNTFEEDAYTYANKLEWWDKKPKHENIFVNKDLSFKKSSDRMDIIQDLEKDINDVLASTSMDNLMAKDILSGHYTEGWSGMSEDTVRYILFELEIEHHESEEHDKILKQDKTSLEHIMPQNDEASKLSEEEHREYVNRIGNLLLLSISENRTASDKKFREKKEDYKSSDSSKMANILGKENTTWGKEKIENRSPKIEAFAEKRWPKTISLLDE